MSRLRLLLAVVILALAGAVLTGPVAAHECADGTKEDCEASTTTTEPETTTTTTEKPKEPETTTTTSAPETTTTTVDDDTTTTTEPTTTSTTWRRRHRTTTTAPPPVFTGGSGGTSEPSTRRTTTTDAPEASAPTSLDPLTYEPVELPTTTEPPVDRSDLETALASTEDGGSRSSSIFGISDTVIALVLGAVAVALLGTGGIRRWMDRS